MTLFSTEKQYWTIQFKYGCEQTTESTFVVALIRETNIKMECNSISPEIKENI